MLKTGPVRHLFVNGLQKAQICLTMAKGKNKQKKPKNRGSSSNGSHQLIYASNSKFLKRECSPSNFSFSKKNFENMLKTAPVRHLFVKGLQKAQICLAMAKKTNQGTSSYGTHKLIYDLIFKCFF